MFDAQGYQALAVATRPPARSLPDILKESVSTRPLVCLTYTVTATIPGPPPADATKTISTSDRLAQVPKYGPGVL